MYPNACCNVPENLFEPESPRRVGGQDASGAARTGTLSVLRCKVCAATHRSIVADPIVMSIKPAAK